MAASFKLSSGFEMPAIGLGTWQSKPGEVGEAVKAAIVAGYRAFDCASIYGNEAEIGEALEDVFKQGTVKREDLFITSKLFHNRHHPDDVRPSLLDSLSKLKLTYLDLYLIHAPVAIKRGGENFPRDEHGNILYEDVNYVDTWKAMEPCVDEGLVRSIGLSNFNSLQIQEVIDNSRIRPAVLQVELHPYFQQHQLVDFCKQRDIVVTSYSSFCSPGWSANKTVGPNFTPVLTEPTLVSLGAKYSKTPAQVILRWLFQRQIVSIPKSVSAERLRQNFQIFDFELSSEDMETIKSVDKNVRVVILYEEKDGKLEYRDRHVPNFPFNAAF